VDGNKRAAVMSGLAFLSVNEVELSMALHEFEAVILKVAAGELGKEKLTSWLRSQTGKRK
jgi:death on curing protein